MLVKIIILLAAVAFANDFVCPYDAMKPFDSQIATCEASILKNECEQQGIKVWSESKVSNNTLQADEVNTSASCKNLGLKIQKIIPGNGIMTVTYSAAQSTDRVHVVTLDQWKDIKVAGQKIAGTLVSKSRQDGTSKFDVDFHVAWDSQKIKLMKERAAQLLAYMKEEYNRK